MRLCLTILMLQVIVAFGQKSDLRVCREQIDTLTKQKIFSTVDSLPKVKGGTEELYKKISKQIRFPHFQSDSDASSIKIIVAFIVNIDGKITGKRTIKNNQGNIVADQLLNIIDDFKWTPGICNNKEVPTLYILPVIMCIKWSD